MSDLQLAVDVADGVMTVGAIAGSRVMAEALGVSLADWLIERSSERWTLLEARTRINESGLAVWRGVWAS